jgi:hypothetical protein
VGRGHGGAAVTDDVAARVRDILQAYDAQGWHRTGTEVDAQSAAWLANTLVEMGAQPTLEEFAFERVEPLAANLQVDGQLIEGLPLFDAPALHGGSLEGPLGAQGSASPVGVMISTSPAPDPEYDAIRKNSAHQALVVITVGPAPGLQARNAGHYKQPFGVPVLQVGSHNLDLLLSAAESKTNARLAIEIRRVAAKSANVVVRIPGANGALAPIVVTTPRTGWWNCSGERGGGIACWFEVLRSALAEPYAREGMFIAFAGHELDFLGIQMFLERHPNMPAAAHAWVHFGANVGAARGAAIRLSASRAEDLEAGRAALERHDVGPVGGPPAGTVIGGESHVAAGLGGRCVALLGGNELFHLESDRWPDNNDVQQIVKQAAAFQALVRQLANEPGGP